MAETPRKPGPGRQNAFRRLAFGPGREKTHFRLRFGAIRADRGPKIVNFGRAGPRSGRPGAGRPTRDVPPAVPALPRPLRPLRSPSQKSPPPPVKNHETMYHNHVKDHMVMNLGLWFFKGEFEIGYFFAEFPFEISQGGVLPFEGS